MRKAWLLWVKVKMRYLRVWWFISYWLYGRWAWYQLVARHYEAFWVWVAARILMERNVTRAPYTSRRDNNDMWYMAERLDRYAKQIRTDYADWDDE